MTPLPIPASVQSIISRLRLRQLKLLIALEEHGTLNRAAEDLAISQPGATKSLNELEALFNAKLFERTPQGLVANDLGRCVTRYARLIQSDLAHMREEMAGIMQGTGGHLALGAITGAIPFLSLVLARLSSAQPELSITITESTSDQLLEQLDDGRLELVFCHTQTSPRPDVYRRLGSYSDQMVLVTNPRHPLAGRDAIQLKDLTDFRWIVYPEGTPMRFALEQAFSRAGLPFPRPLVETSSAFSQLYLLHENPTMIAQVPFRVAKFGAKLGMAQKLPYEVDSSSLAHELLMRKSAPLSPAATLFLQEIERHEASLLPPIAAHAL